MRIPSSARRCEHWNREEHERWISSRNVRVRGKGAERTFSDLAHVHCHARRISFSSHRLQSAHAVVVLVLRPDTRAQAASAGQRRFLSIHEYQSVKLLNAASPSHLVLLLKAYNYPVRRPHAQEHCCAHSRGGVRRRKELGYAPMSVCTRAHDSRDSPPARTL